MELVTLPAAHVLWETRTTPRYAHFLVSGLASLAMVLKNGDGMDVGIVGAEGLVTAAFLTGPIENPARAIMQVEGAAYRIPLAELRTEYLLSQDLRSLVLRSTQQQLLLANQLAVCNYYHSVEARLARWLLMVSDRVRKPAFRITHGFLAQMLGVRRPTLTLTARKLQHEGSIQYRRGLILIQDRASLVRRACECYADIKTLY